MATHSQAQKPVQVDVCVYGATSAGIVAAYTASISSHIFLAIMHF